MVKDGNAEKVAGLTEAGGEHTVFGAGRRIPGRVIVRADDGGAIHEDGGFEDFARMDDADSLQNGLLLLPFKRKEFR